MPDYSAPRLGYSDYVIVCSGWRVLSTKLHYTDTGYGHVYNTTNGRAHNNSTTCCTTNLPHSNARAKTSRHVKMLGCGNFLLVCGEFVVQQVVELL